MICFELFHHYLLERAHIDGHMHQTEKPAPYGTVSFDPQSLGFTSAPIGTGDFIKISKQDLPCSANESFSINS
jgi:hypothetical protein